jgi:hypothetical protein
LLCEVTFDANEKHIEKRSGRRIKRFFETCMLFAFTGRFCENLLWSETEENFRSSLEALRELSNKDERIEQKKKEEKTSGSSLIRIKYLIIFFWSTNFQITDSVSPSASLHRKSFSFCVILKSSYIYLTSFLRQWQRAEKMPCKWQL